MRLLNTLFKNKENMSQEEVYNKFIKLYHKKLEDNKNSDLEMDITEVPELTDDIIKQALDAYFSASKLEDAWKCLEAFINTIIPNPEVNYNDPNWKTSDTYKQYRYSLNVSWILSDVKYSANLPQAWVNLHGKRHTNEEAAKIAAEKVMELCFGWHLQDNGALNEEHSFMMCALGSSLGNDAKAGISADVKEKAYELFYKFFLGYLDPDSVGGNYQKWLRENAPSSNPERFNWEFLKGELYCDYGPNWAWSTLLEAAGVDERSASLICPWKTGIKINVIDNAVMYSTYQNVDYL